VGVIHVDGVDQRSPQKADRFVDGRHENIDAQTFRRGRGLANRQTPGHEQMHQHGTETEQLRAIERIREHPCLRVEGAPSPGQVPQRNHNKRCDQNFSRQFQLFKGRIFFQGVVSE